MDTDSEQKRSRRRSPDHPPSEWSHSGPLGGIENLAAAAAYQSNPPSSTPVSPPPPCRGGVPLGRLTPTGGAVISGPRSESILSGHTCTHCHFHQLPRLHIKADQQPATYPYPFGLTPYRYPCLTPHLPQPPPGDPGNPHFRAFDPTEAEAFHQSLVQNNQAYSTLASYLDDGKEKA